LVPEFYPGWLDHWGEPKSITDGDVPSYKKLLETGASVSLYMFHGGTNFGFMAGANYGGNYQPDITSYDYDAPLDEAGRPREKYFKFRQAIEEVTGKALPPVPPAPKVVQVPPFELRPAGSPLDSLPKPVKALRPLPMERLGQAYGFVLYRTHVKGPISGELKPKDLRDFALVMLDGKGLFTLDRRAKQESMYISIPEGNHKLELWVENCGRINYGGRLPDNLKGITESVWIGNEELTGWEMYSMPLSMMPSAHPQPPRPARDRKDSDPIFLSYEGSQSYVQPSYFGGSFKLEEVGELFLDTSGWGKGVVWVNGHNIGRYWSIGPQQTLYVPSCWLRQGENIVRVLEDSELDLLGLQKSREMRGLPKPLLNELGGLGP